MEIIEVVINCGYGGFGLSDEALQWLKEHKGLTSDTYSLDGQRDSKDLVEVVKALGNKASAPSASLVVQKAVKDHWCLHEYDGDESVGWRKPAIDVKSIVFDAKMTDTEKVETLKQHYEQDQMLWAEFEPISHKIRTQNEEAVREFHRIRLNRPPRNPDDEPTLLDIMPNVFSS